MNDGKTTLVLKDSKESSSYGIAMQLSQLKDEDANPSVFLLSISTPNVVKPKKWF